MRAMKITAPRAQRRNAERKEKFNRLRQIRKLRWAATMKGWKLAERAEYLESQRDAVMEKLNA